MERKAIWARTSAGLFVVSAWGIGCSLVNSYGDLAPQKAGEDGSTSDSMPSPDVGTGSDAQATEASSGEAGVDAGPRGAIVIGGAAESDGGEQYVLTALDPATGSELPNARKTLTVSAIEYDGATDVWYVFESGGQGIFPLPSDPFFVHAMKLDVVTGDWTELGKARIPAALSFATTGVEGQRVSYVAYGDGSEAGVDDSGIDGGAPFSLVTLDTSNPAAITVSSTLLLPSSPFAVIGRRSAVNAAGGFATLGASGTGTSGKVAQLTPVLIPATDPPSVEQPILGSAAIGGQIGYGAVTVHGTSDVAVVSRGFGGTTTPATVQIFDPSANDPTMALVGQGTFTFGDGNVKAPAFSECAQMLFVVGTNADLNVYAVSLASAFAPAADGGVPSLAYASAPTGHSGQSVYFEPFTNTVLVPFGQGNNFALTAFTLGGNSSAPTLTPRQAPRWVPPKDLRPSFVATRTPTPFTCPVLGDL